jgi:hypothetical protein
MKKNLQIGKKIALALLLLVTASVVNAADRYLIATGNWNATATWAASAAGAPGASVPVAGDNVFIQGTRTVTITADAACATITFANGASANGTVTLNSSVTLDVSGLITIPRAASGFSNTLAVGAGTLNAGSIAFTNGGGVSTRHRVTISTGTVVVSGNVTQTGSTGSASFDFTGAGLLRLGGTMFSATTGSLTASTGTVEYNAAGAQTVGNFTYNNLILSNTGAKTITGSTINGSLIIRGTATATGTAPTYGASAVLEYDGSAAQSPSTTEFPASLGADLVISNTSGVTLPASKAVSGTVTINSGASLTIGAFDFSVTGTTTIDGTLTVNSATGTKSFDNLIVNSGGTFNSSVNENYAMTGNLTVNGTFTAGTGTYTWSSSGVFSGTATIPNVTVNGGGPVTLTNNGNLTVSALAGGDSYVQGATGVLNYSGATVGVANFTASATGNIVNYNAAGAQTIDNTTYSNLVLSGSGAKATAGPVTVNDKFSLQGTATVSNTITYSTAILEYKGSAPQTTSNNEFPIAGTGITQLIIDNADGVTLNNAKALSGILNLTNGDLNTNNSNLLTIAAGGSISGGSASSHVNGPLSKTGNTPFTFPVGNGTLYRPVSISSVSAVATVRATYFQANPRTLFGTTGTGATLPIKQVSLCEYWDLNDGGAGINAIVGLQYSSTSPCTSYGYITDPSTLIVAHWNTTTLTWESKGATVGTTLTNMTASATSTFSPFTIGTTNATFNPLPVSFTDVKAFEKGAAVQIDWTNSTESDMSAYLIERSADGINFSVIGQTAPRSNQFDKVNYTYIDAAPLAGTNFYRIKAIELSGKNVYSKALRVDIGRNPKGISLYPNPVRGSELTIGFSALKGQYSLNVVNTAGQVVYRQSLNHAGGTVAQTVSLPVALKAGVYNVLISGDNYKETKTFVIQ